MLRCRVCGVCLSKSSSTFKGRLQSAHSVPKNHFTTMHSSCNSRVFTGPWSKVHLQFGSRRLKTTWRPQCLFATHLPRTSGISREREIGSLFDKRSLVCRNEQDTFRSVCGARSRFWDSERKILVTSVLWRKPVGMPDRRGIETSVQTMKPRWSE